MMSAGTGASFTGSGGILRAISGVILLVILAWQGALAVTTQTFTVGATIAPGCSVASGSGGVFGSLNFGTRTGVQTGQVSTSFVRRVAVFWGVLGVALSMSINGGQNYSTVRNLQRTGGTDRVPYRLYSSSTLAANTEIGVNQSVSVAYTDSNNIALSIFGAATLTGFSPAGTYTDQLTRPCHGNKGDVHESDLIRPGGRIHAGSRADDSRLCAGCGDDFIVAHRSVDGGKHECDRIVDPESG